MSALQALKKALGENALVTPERVQASPGCPTGIAKLDGFLLWKGFPKGALSLFSGETGMGATRIWLQAAERLTHDGRWAAWMNGRESELNGAAVRKLGLNRFFWISAPGTAASTVPAADLKQRLWAIQELCSLCLFDLVGCDLENFKLKDSQILKLKKLALRYQVALVLFSRTQKSHPFFSLVMEFDKHKLAVARALHRATPHFIERRELYADTLPQLAAGRRALRG